MARQGIICGGGIMIDVNKIVDRFPPREQVAIIEAETPDSGGPGFNIAVDLARLGAPFPIALVGLIGDDAHGRQIRAICRDHNIGTAGLRVLPDLRTSYTDVMIERADGRRTFFHFKGACARLAPEHFDFTGTTARIFHIGSPGALDALDAANADGNGFVTLLKKARAAGLATNMELVPVAAERIRALVPPCLPLLDTLICNEFEAGAITGIEANADGRIDWRRAEAAAAELIRLGVRQLAVVHFPEGCIAAAPGGRLWRQGAVRLPADRIVSANGAGDAFASGVMFGLHEGWPVERGLQLGCAVAAASLGAHSTSGGIGSAEECLAYAAGFGFASEPWMMGVTR